MSDLKFWDVFRDPLWLLHNLMNKYKHIVVPSNAGWDTNNVNGTVTQQPLRIYVATSITASSRGMAYCGTTGLNSGNANSAIVDWTKRLELSFILNRSFSDVEVVARVQLKDSAAAVTEGVLANLGIGLQISNLTVVGEAYGTARQTTGTLKTLTSGYGIRVKIVLTSTAVEFWVNGVLVESLTGTAVPPVAGVDNNYLVLSIINGVTGGVNARVYLTNIEVVQAW